MVDAIIAAREDDDGSDDSADDSIELPPSSPRAGSEYSSDGDEEADDGNIAGGEETDSVGPYRRARGNTANPLRRRATVNDFGGGIGRPSKGRSLSLGQIGSPTDSSKGKLGRGVGDGRSVNIEASYVCKLTPPVPRIFSRRRTTTHGSLRSSPTGSMSSHTAYLPSPPATRTRSRRTSAETWTSTKTAQAKGKGRAKQVEFSDDVQVQLASPLSMVSDEEDELDVTSHVAVQDEESDLTDLSELEEELQRTPRAKGVNMTAPSPRRLRSKGSKTSSASETDAAPPVSADVDRRVTPMRKAKGKIGNLREDSESVGEDVDLDVDEEESDEVAEDDEEGVQDEEEVDELASSPSPTPSAQGQRSIQRCLRPRRGQTQTHTPPSDGDDEEEVEVEEAEGEEAEEDVDGSEMEADDDAEEETASATPRKLRSGRIVGEEDVDVDEEETEGDEVEAEDAEEEEGDDVEGDDVERDDAEEVDDAESIDIDAEGETEEDSDEAMEDGKFLFSTMLSLRCSSYVYQTSILQSQLLKHWFAFAETI